MDTKGLYTGIVSQAKIPMLKALIEDSSTSVICLLTPKPSDIESSIQRLNSLLEYEPSNAKKITLQLSAFPESPPLEIDPEIRQRRNAQRLSSLLQIQSPSSDSLCIVATPEALFGNFPSLSSIEENACFLEVGQTYNFQELIEKLTKRLNYDAEAACERIGEIAIRGGLIDIYPIDQKQPYRIDFFGDEIESIRIFDPASQRSIGNENSLTIPPNCPSESSENTLADFLPEKAMTWLFDDPKILEREHAYRMSSSRGGAEVKTLMDIFRLRQRFNDSLIGICEFDLEPILFDALPRIEMQTGNDSLKAPIREHKRTHSRSEIKDAKSDTGFTLSYRQQQLDSILEKFNAPLPSKVFCSLKNKLNRELVLDTLDLMNRIDRNQLKLIESKHLETVFIRPNPSLKSLNEGFLLLEESSLIGDEPTPKSPSYKKSLSQVLHLLDFSELIEGDLLIHLQHGLCRYREVRQLELEGNRSEVITVEFDRSMLLHVPIREAHLLTRYLSFSKRSVKLAKIGSSQWIKTRTQAEHASLDYASKLLKVQAERSYQQGFAYPVDHPWQSIFEAEFPYTETDDQLQAIEATKRDMESSVPMDRLICGDVGYGKTEVAIRAAFKAVIAGKQVAILVPTTVLCQQHHITFKERFSEFPVSIESVSGFYSPQRNKRILADVSQGKVDLIIGTHRLLSKDVSFKDLGLLVVDEEQRFGVKQKEKIKDLARNVDILTLTATPIPRTLHLALSGARAMSVIETAPLERKPIQTFVKSYDLQLIKEAIRKETDRRGQVFYLHNRVETIQSVASRLCEQLPDLKIEVGHGQMDEGVLEKTMVRFINGDFDVLVCTTIIESGIDIPNCNTLIIEGADRFGLAQLYQIRGRVGRFTKQAYAYLFLHRHSALVDSAHKRLSTLKQYNQLGAGFRIAMRDLELRGAGNILGAEQSGHISNIGFELYCQLLKESVARLNDEPQSKHISAEVHLDFIVYGETLTDAAKPVPAQKKPRAFIGNDVAETLSDYGTASIPQAYIGEASLRIHFHRALSLAKENEDLHRIQLELSDRFGEIPPALSLLIKIHSIRILAEEAGFKLIKSDGERLICSYAHSKKDFYKIGSRFPRLTQKSAKLKLSEIQKFLKNLSSKS